MWVKDIPSPGRRGLPIHLLRKVCESCHHPGLCPLRLQLLVFWIPTSGQGPGGTAGLGFHLETFTWLHMKGRLKRRESQRETALQSNLGCVAVTHAASFIKKLGSRDGRSIRTILYQQQFQQTLNYFAREKKSRTVDPLYFAINVCF